MAVRPWNHLSLCDGYGGWSRTWPLLGWNVRTVCRVERDAHAASVLVARMDDQALDQAPVWDDVITFDGVPWRGRVDVVTAGFPCQPFSSAGKGAGTDDDRWLWPSIQRVVAEVRPSVVVLENVPGLRTKGLPEVLSGLASLGFDAEWGLFSAAAIGAPHKRERLWILAYADSELVRNEQEPQPRSSTTPEPGGSCPFMEALADATSVDEREPHLQASAVAWSDPRLHAGGGSGGVHSDFGLPGLFPPGRDDYDGWAGYVFDGGPEPGLRRSPDGASGRVVRPAGLADRLHLLGNGHVPQCAAEAVRQLAARIMS